MMIWAGASCHSAPTRARPQSGMGGSAWRPWIAGAFGDVHDARRAGGRRGAQHPLASRNVKRCVGWLTDLNSRKPALGGAAETASQSTVRSSVHRAVAGKLRGLSIAGLKDGEGDGRPRHLPGDGSALCGPPLFALPLTPREPEIVDLGRSQRP